VVADNKAKVISISKSEREQWRAVMKPVWAQFEADIGKDLIDAAIQANEKPAPQKKKSDKKVKSEHKSEKK